MFYLKSSRILLSLMIVIGMLGIIHIWLLPWDSSLLIVLTFGFCYVWFQSLCLDGLLSKQQSIVALEPLSPQTWQLYLNNQQCIQAVLEGDSVVTAWLCVLRFRSVTGRLYLCMIFKDTLYTLDYHRLLLVTKMS